ncbi:hypothetical protein Ppb6_02985 [Photorhabdus australis subsp. thailandensis]|uniref:Uncharacterized protein n=1 Tax=Photorhabdus australis subsp. thailandensis TaxID=2805096 RepID=A0A1C0U1Q4_9GAMM|nr:hypothetical protein Ppb6_02985 [Photorhabdus australis subsp. thailandensis]
MAIPAYIWLQDDDGADIKGSVDVQNREGSIEILSFIPNRFQVAVRRQENASPGA